METQTFELTKIAYAFNWIVVIEVQNNKTHQIELLKVKEVMARNYETALIFAHHYRIPNWVEFQGYVSAVCTGVIDYAFDSVTLQSVSKEDRKQIPIPENWLRPLMRAQFNNTKKI